MIQTIFQEPPEDIDESFTHGALLGGMCGYSDVDLADAYFVAGDTLANAVLSGGATAVELIRPVLYVYRHGIELYLKCIVRPTVRDHNLGALLEAFCRHVRSRYGEGVPKWVTKPISEFVKYDPASDVFRYEDTRSRALQDGGEFWVDLRSVRRAMVSLRVVFRRVIIADASGAIPPAGVG